MEKIMYPLKNMWITCVPGQYLHKYCQAIDDQGKDYATIDKIYAPFTGKVVRKYPSECEIWFESIDKVEFADGTIDYATMLLAHKDRYDDIKEGSIYKQGEVIYSEGTKAGNKVISADYTESGELYYKIMPYVDKNNQLKKDGFTFDTGPSFFSMSYEFIEFVRECGIEMPFDDVVNMK